MAAKALTMYRNISTFRTLFGSLKQPLETQEAHKKGASEMWKKMFFFMCCPAIAVSLIHVKTQEKHPRPEFKKYEHLRIRRKKFPWRDGVKTLFHNPRKNALPDGYEMPE